MYKRLMYSKIVPWEKKNLHPQDNTSFLSPGAVAPGHSSSRDWTQRSIAKQRGSHQLWIYPSQKIPHSTLADWGPENHIPSWWKLSFCLILAVAGLHLGHVRKLEQVPNLKTAVCGTLLNRFCIEVLAVSYGRAVKWYRNVKNYGMLSE